MKLVWNFLYHILLNIMERYNRWLYLFNILLHNYFNLFLSFMTKFDWLGCLILKLWIPYNASMPEIIYTVLNIVIFYRTLDSIVVCTILPVPILISYSKIKHGKQICYGSNVIDFSNIFDIFAISFSFRSSGRNNFSGLWACRWVWSSVQC